MTAFRVVLFSSLSLFLYGCALFMFGATLLSYVEFYLPPLELRDLVVSVDGVLVLLFLVIGLSIVGLSFGLVSISLRWPLAKWRPPSFKTLLYKHLLILVIASNILAFTPLAKGRVEIRGLMFPPNQEFHLDEPINIPHPNDKPSSLADTILKITVMGIYDAEMSHTASSKVRVYYFTILIILSVLLLILLPLRQQRYLENI